MAISVASISLCPEWSAALAEIAGGEQRRVVVLGAVDAGKSSFVLALGAAWCAAGCNWWLLDVDPGQKMVGPPGTVSLGHTGCRGDTVLAAIRFTGTLSAAPIGALSDAAAKLAPRCSGSRLVVNTSGFVRGPGVRLQRATVEQAAADLVVAIGAPDDVAPLVAQVAAPVLRIGRSPTARRKTPRERAALRQAAFAAYLAGAERWTLPPDIRVEPGVTTCLVRSLARPVCALVDAGGTHLCLGVLEAADEAGVVVTAPPVRRRVAGVRVGAMWAQPAGTGWTLLDELLPVAGQ